MLDIFSLYLASKRKLEKDMSFRPLSKAVFLSCFLLAYTSTLFADGINMSAEVDVFQSFWVSGDDDDGDGGPDETENVNAIDYDTISLPVLSGRFAIKKDSFTLFSADVKRSLDEHVDQDELLQKTADDSSSLESYLLKAAPFLLFTGSPDYIRNVRIDYRRRLFFGTGKASNETIYFSQDGTQTDLFPGDQIAVKADFKEWQLTWPVGTGNRSSGARLGFYQTQTNKPNESSFYTSRIGSSMTIAVVLDMDIDSKGFVWLNEGESSTLALRVGRVKFKGSVAGTNPFDGSGLDFSVDYEWHPLMIDNESGFNAGFFLGTQFRIQFADIEQDRVGDFFHDGSGQDSLDILFDVGFRMRYR